MKVIVKTDIPKSDTCRRCSHHLRDKHRRTYWCNLFEEALEHDEAIGTAMKLKECVRACEQAKEETGQWLNRR